MGGISFHEDLVTRDLTKRIVQLPGGSYLEERIAKVDRVGRLRHPLMILQERQPAEKPIPENVPGDQGLQCSFDQERRATSGQSACGRVSRPGVHEALTLASRANGALRRQPCSTT